MRNSLRASQGYQDRRPTAHCNAYVIAPGSHLQTQFQGNIKANSGDGAECERLVRICEVRESIMEVTEP